MIRGMGSEIKYPLFVESDLDDLGLTPFEFRILARIYRRWNAKDGCFESMTAMAKACRMSLWAVRRALATLERRHMIRRTHRKGRSYRFDPLPKSEWTTEGLPPKIKKTRSKTSRAVIGQDSALDLTLGSNASHSASGSVTPTQSEMGNQSGTPIKSDKGTGPTTPVKSDRGIRSMTPIKSGRGTGSSTPIKSDKGSPSKAPVTSDTPIKFDIRRYSP